MNPDIQSQMKAQDPDAVLADMEAGRGSVFPYSTIPLPDGIVIGGPWPDTIISWPGGKCRSATKPEYDLFQALEKAHAQLQTLNSTPQHDSP